MSKTVFLALLALVCSVAAHAGHGGDMPYGWRNTRAITASSCAAFTCAVSLGNCNANTFCLNGEHCGSNALCKTTTAVNVGDTCDVADENGCLKGKCISGTCQIVNEIMPGNECKFDTECYYSETADGSGAIGGKCVAGICSGKTVNEVCLASHQCVVGHFCTKSGTCQPVGTTSNDACTADNECSSRLSCIRGFCTAPFSHNLGETCVDTNDCSSGLYCNPKSSVCTKAVATTSTAQCDINTNNCPADHECACRGTGTVATCGAYVGTADNMASIESAAFACLSKHSCSSDTANSTALECIKTKCPKEYCTYFSRSMSELYGMSECVRARALDNPALYNLAQACAAYAPSATTSSAGVLSASVLVVLVSVVALLF